MNKTPPAICLHGTLSSGDEGRQIWGKVLLILNIFIIDICTREPEEEKEARNCSGIKRKALQRGV